MMRPQWAARLRLAALLGVSPRDFWRLSVREWRALSGGVAAPAMERAAFEALVKEFPDKANG